LRSDTHLCEHCLPLEHSVEAEVRRRSRGTGEQTSRTGTIARPIRARRPVRQGLVGNNAVSRPRAVAVAIADVQPGKSFVIVMDARSGRLII